MEEGAQPVLDSNCTDKAEVYLNHPGAWIGSEVLVITSSFIGEHYSPLLFFSPI